MQFLEQFFTEIRGKQVDLSEQSYNAFCSPIKNVVVAFTQGGRMLNVTNE